MEPQDDPRLKTVRRELQLIRERAETAINLIDSIIETYSSSDASESFKGTNGRLTESAIRAINAAYDAGMSVSEVSDQFDVAISTAIYRKKLWKEEQNTNYARMHAKILAGKSIAEKDRMLLRRRGLDEDQIAVFEKLQIKSNDGTINQSEREKLIELSNIATIEK